VGWRNQLLRSEGEEAGGLALQGSKVELTLALRTASQWMLTAGLRGA
jgi:hypothetical protein